MVTVIAEESAAEHFFRITKTAFGPFFLYYEKSRRTSAQLEFNLADLIRTSWNSLIPYMEEVAALAEQRATYGLIGDRMGVTFYPA